MIKSYIEKAAENQLLFAVYSSSDKPSSFEVGRLIEMDEECLMMRTFAETGNADGFLVLRLEDIHRFETKSKYLKAMEKLINLQAEQEMLLPDLTGSCIDDAFQYAKEAHKIITVCLIDRSSPLITGFVKQLNDDTVALNVIDQYGEPDGEIVFYKDDCCLVSCMSAEENRLEKLYAAR